MEVVAKELGALKPTVAIEDSKVADWDLRVKFQVLNALVRIFHTFSLTDVADDTRVVALYLEFKRSNPKGIVRLEHEFLIRLQAPVDTT